jgi:hypothetical protein
LRHPTVANRQRAEHPSPPTIVDELLDAARTVPPVSDPVDAGAVTSGDAAAGAGRGVGVGPR